MAKLKEAHKRVAAKRKKPAVSLESQLIEQMEAKEPDAKEIMRLITRGVAINTRTFGGDPLLVFATRKNMIPVVKKLLDKGADPDITCSRGQCALLVTSWMGFSDIAVMLLEKGANPNIPEGGLYPLALACQYGYDYIAKNLIEKGAKLDVQDSYGKTPLNRAAYGGYEIIVEALLAAGANVDLADNDGHTPLMSVGLVECRRDFVGPDRKKMRIAEMLIEAGADTMREDKNSNTAQAIAGNSKHSEINGMIRDKNEKNDRDALAEGLPLRKAIKIGSPLKLRIAAP